MPIKKKSKFMVLIVRNTKTLLILTSLFVSVTSCSVVQEQQLPKTSSGYEPASQTIESKNPIANESLVAYPENFLTMSEEPIDFSQLPEPLELYTHDGVNGMIKLLDYGIFDVVALEYAGDSNLNIIEYDFKDSMFITSEAVAVGSKKVDVLAAYEKYGIKEYPADMLLDFNVRYSSITILESKKTTNNFLYVDNGRVFDIDYIGTDYWGGLGAFIFIFDDADIVTMIIRVAPTAG